MCRINKTKSLNNNFVITNIILSMKGEFTIDQACTAVKDKDLNVSKNMIIGVIKRLRENDYLKEIGLKYSVIPSQNSTRWNMN